MTTSLYQVTENPIVYYVVSNPSLTIQNGSHPRGMVMRAWGTQRHVPPICGSPVQTRNGEACKAIPTWFQNGRWSCGHHRLDKTMNRSGFKRPAPPPPPPPPPFESFECSICISKCRNVKNKYITPCNHSFHRRCMKEWYARNNGRNTLECPLCRTKITRHPFKRRSIKPTVNNIQRALDTNLHFRNNRERLIALEAVVAHIGLPPREISNLVYRDIHAMYHPITDPDEMAEEWTNRIMSGLIDLGTALGELIRAPIA